MDVSLTRRTSKGFMTRPTTTADTDTDAGALETEAANSRRIEFTLENVTYRVDAPDGTVRPCLSDGVTWGPVVGHCSDTTNLTTVLDTLDLDPLQQYGYGPYVMELLHSTPVQLRESAAARFLTSMSQQTVNRMRHELQTRGLVVWEQAVSSEQVLTWRQAILQSNDTTNSKDNHPILHSEWQDNGQDASIRSDVVRFVSQQEQRQEESSETISNNTATAACQVLDVLEHVVTSVTQGAATFADTVSLWRPNQGMMAHYLANRKAHYTWHTDNELIDDNSSIWRNFRTVTAIMYLNHPLDWQLERDGGGLACQLPDSSPPSTLSSTSSTSILTVAPQGGTIVLFDSRTIRHSVQPAHRDRLAVTQWFVSPELNQESSGKCLPLSSSVPPRPKRQRKENDTNTDKANPSFCQVFASTSSPPGSYNAEQEKETFSFDFFQAK